MPEIIFLTICTICLWKFAMATKEWFGAFALLVCVTSAMKTVIVQTPSGMLQGLKRVLPDQSMVLSFTGIPYAKPPVGDLRFARPQPHPAFDGLFDATKNATFCPHPRRSMNNENVYDEDCLVLNVFIKNVDPVPSNGSTSSERENENKKKVIVYIHGGGYIIYSSHEYPPINFVKMQDVIFVTINYRLGALGFLNTGDEVSPGNQGLWDMVMALRWVQDNIAAFGGDPTDVTIAGQSAGASAVTCLALSPVTKGLFTKVYAQSGGATSAFTTNVNPTEPTLDVAKAVGCLEGYSARFEHGQQVNLTVKDNQDIINCLKNVSVDTLQEFSMFNVDKTRFSPIVDGHFLPRYPSELLKDDAYLESIGFFKRKYLFGFDNYERQILDLPILATERELSRIEGKSEDEKKEMINRFHQDAQQYHVSARLGLSSFVSPSPENLVKKIATWYKRRFTGRITVYLSTDINFIVPAYDFLNAIARSRDAKSYLFYFNHYPKFMIGSTLRGTTHNADLMYWFDRGVPGLEADMRAGISGGFDVEDHQLRALFSDMIGQFVKTGNPWNGLKQELPGGWPPFDIQGNHYLDFNPKPQVRRHLKHEVRDFWLETAPRWAAEAKSSG